MLKESDKYKDNSTHFSYDDYKHRVKKEGNKDIAIFISVFVIGLLIILGFVKLLSPNVDVGIASSDEYSQYEDEKEFQSSVDDRLKKIQSDDNGGKGDSTMFSPELDEKVVLPKQIKKTVGEMEAEMQDAKLQQQKAIQITPPKPTVEEIPKIEKPAIKVEVPAPVQPQKPKAAPAPTQQITNAKVVVGYYATEKQAEVAKTIIQDAGLGVTPTVKDMGGYYTLQVGSYTSKEKAQQAANNLLKSNFPARVIVE